ncbi:aminotransferase class I/II-fold pyridoxal phosphate-dependent enzyme [Lactobacillus sp. UCMA15818]|uniref:trans-sulfuration enzyme family protein n=1 Tax=Lactobacillus sp. UCMA15818 TaxID=2583394 RepID=UPI0025B1AE13|nr:aminotransferase class I/II-fold pyridoxal phosphate-dependent enzyme [Lactobacillus sp. UCMA15818]MDN2454427.1 aminotransferase class I/II-fold pyridoxal phosphate-dependent enzyme [Lactobacillus sp. UCMA15818]
MTELNRETGILYKGSRIDTIAKDPETMPLYMTTAFNVDDLEDLQERYKVKGYTYIRTRNPNRKALADLMTYLEGGEDSIVCSSGMAAISTAILTITKTQAHVIADSTLYGESIELLEKLKKFGVNVTFVDINNLDEVKAAFKDETVAIYSETISNPMINTIDFRAIANIAHENGAKLIIDNTFATSHIISPIQLGADIVVNSLTKFANGHSDVCVGSITSTIDFIKEANYLQQLLGSTADPMSAWLCERGIRTMELRVQKQSDNALAIAKFLETIPVVKTVHYVGLDSHPQHELAAGQFKHHAFGGMLSFELPDDEEKMNEFMHRLSFVHYAMTLGGFRTTISVPAFSSHYDMPREKRLLLGITDGMIRISVGIENSTDLINDLKNALEVYN